MKQRHYPVAVSTFQILQVHIDKRTEQEYVMMPDRKRVERYFLVPAPEVRQENPLPFLMFVEGMFLLSLVAELEVYCQYDKEAHDTDENEYHLDEHDLPWCEILFERCMEWYHGDVSGLSVALKSLLYQVDNMKRTNKQRENGVRQ